MCNKTYMISNIWLVLLLVFYFTSAPIKNIILHYNRPNSPIMEDEVCTKWLILLVLGPLGQKLRDTYFSTFDSSNPKKVKTGDENYVWFINILQWYGRIVIRKVIAMNRKYCTGEKCKTHAHKMEQKNGDLRLKRT